VFIVSEATMLMQLAAAVVIGVVAACLPAWRAARVRIVEGLRAIA
jgi:putative ABC transport system permease protein